MLWEPQVSGVGWICPRRSCAFQLEYSPRTMMTGPVADDGEDSDGCEESGGGGEAMRCLLVDELGE